MNFWMSAKMAQSFTHQGVTYTIRERTIFDADWSGSALNDILRHVLLARGYKDTDYYPLVFHNMMKRFVDWMQVTTIKGDVPYAKVDLWDFRAEHVPLFDAWLNAIRGDGELASKWLIAYKAVNFEENDPNANGGAPTSDSTTPATSSAANES